MAIGQAMLYAGYLDCLGNQIPVFRDDFTLYRPGEVSSMGLFIRDGRPPDFFLFFFVEKKNLSRASFLSLKKMAV